MVVYKLPHLETNITVACQNKCVSCNHFVPLQKPQHAKPAQIERDLAALGRVAHADAFGLLGGEPLLHPNIIDILDIAKRSKIADSIEVWTNGMLLDEMSPAFWHLTDKIVVSVYPGKLQDDWHTMAQEKAKLYNTAIEVKANEPFTYLLNGKDAQEKYDTCWYRTFTHVVDNGFFYRCCTSPFIPKLLLNRFEGTDGLNLNGITEDKLIKFMDRKEAMKSCEVCAGHRAGRHEWKEAPKRSEWLELSTED